LKHENDYYVLQLLITFYIPCEFLYEGILDSLGLLDEDVKNYLKYLRRPREAFITLIGMFLCRLGFEKVKDGPVRGKYYVTDVESGTERGV